MDFKNCYLCGNTIHQGQGFSKEGASFCSQNCYQQVTASSIRQQQRAQEVGGCFGALGDILRGLASLAVAGFVILFIVAKACSSNDSTTSTPEPEIELSATQETNEGNNAEEQLPEPVPEAAPTPPATMDDGTEASAPADSTEQPDLLELMETPAQ